MSTRRILLVSLTVLLLSPVSANWAQNHRDPNRDTPLPARPEEMPQLIKDLDKPELRMHALSRLIGWSLWPTRRVPTLTYPTTDSELTDRLNRAIEATCRSATMADVAQALDTNDRNLRFWGLWNWNPAGCQPADERCAVALTLLPRIKKLAMDEDDSSVRREALYRLKYYHLEAEFLAERMAAETSPYVLRRVLYGESADKFNKYMNLKVLGFLDSKDEEIRRVSLNFIGDNSYTSETTVVDFTIQIFNRVIELTRSKSERERAEAVSALGTVKSIDPSRSRAAFIRMSEDPAEEVRSRVPWVWLQNIRGGGLSPDLEELNREDVKAVISRLIHDPSPEVRYWTIVSAGDKNYIPELEELTHCSDPRTVAAATSRLKMVLERPK